MADDAVPPTVAPALVMIFCGGLTVWFGFVNVNTAMYTVALIATVASAAVTAFARVAARSPDRV
jgi:hypothetical protein